MAREPEDNAEDEGGDSFAARLNARLGQSSPLAAAAEVDPQHPLARTVITDADLQMPPEPADGVGDLEDGFEPAELAEPVEGSAGQVADEDAQAMSPESDPALDTAARPSVDVPEAERLPDAVRSPRAPQIVQRQPAAVRAPMPKAVPAPAKNTSPNTPIRLSTTANEDDFNHLSDSSRERLESLISRHDALNTPDAETTAPAPVSEPERMPPAGQEPVAETAPTAAASQATERRASTSDIKASLKALRLRRDGELWTALLQSRPALMSVGAFSFVINLLMLTGPLFMLQVYDRVMTSGSMPTLVALSLLTAALYGAIGVFEFIRSRVVVRVGLEFDRRIADRVFRAALRRSVFGRGTSIAALRELDSIRQFVSGPGPLALFDVPWTPIYLLIIFAFHWMLGVAATIGAAILLVLAYVSERSSREPLLESSKASGESLDVAEVGQRNAEAIVAMGMVDAYRKRWQKTNAEALAWQGLAADRLGSVTATTKTLRLGFQSMMLAVGAALAIYNEISAGTIVAATIIFGRALAPVEQALGQWRGLLRAVDSFAKIDDLLRKEPEPEARTALPDPKGVIEVQGLRVAAPETRKLILANVTFQVSPGQMLAVIGPSASGKSTLSRALVGLWPLQAGTIRLDGATLEQWGADQLGNHVGYLPQTIELFDGTVR
ncbi:MAG: ABC transporter transmembrane domain-containing protein, partial [Pseudomonadota bacterium]